ncbi:competence pheromone ComX [Bacillus vallismortis]|uniref:competence pheromone ComX n=1 Tax=Bacillus vallismortis TaxID=72361 RepID=UPI0034617550
MKHIDKIISHLANNPEAFDQFKNGNLTLLNINEKEKKAILYAFEEGEVPRTSKWPPIEAISNFFEDDKRNSFI